MSMLFALALQAPAQQTSPRPKISQARLNAISDGCRAPRSWLELRGDEIVFRADPDAGYARIECVLRKVSADHPTTNLGLIGNAPVPEEK